MLTLRTLITAGLALLPLAVVAANKKPEPGAPDEIRQLVRRYFDMWNRLDPSRAAESLAGDVAGHVNNDGFRGLEVLHKRVAGLKAVYSDHSFTIEDLVVEGDRAVARWRFRGRHSGPYLGHPASNKDITVTGMNMFRVAGNRIVEIWVNADDLGELEQMGLVKAPH